MWDSEVGDSSHHGVKGTQVAPVGDRRSRASFYTRSGMSKREVLWMIMEHPSYNRAVRATFPRCFDPLTDQFATAVKQLCNSGQLLQWWRLCS